MNFTGELSKIHPKAPSWPGLLEGLGLGTDSVILRMESYDFYGDLSWIYDDFHRGIYDDLLMIY